MSKFSIRITLAIVFLVSVWVKTLVGDQGNSPSYGVQSLTCSGTDKLSAVGPESVCSADQGGGGSIPAGAVVLIVSGSCSATLGAGWTEESTLNGKFVLGTINSAADIGGTGGQDSVTSVLNHTHGVTDPGHNHTQDAHNHTQDAHTHTQNSHNHTQDPHSHGMAEGQTDGAGTLMDRSNAASATTTTTDAATATNQAATATNQNATATNQAATATNQSNTTGVTTQNPAGGVASIDNRPAFVKVIFCKKD